MYIRVDLGFNVGGNVGVGVGVNGRITMGVCI